MQRLSALLLGFFWLMISVSYAQSTDVVLAIKKPVTFKGPVYFASNINGWNPADTNFRFTEGQDAYVLKIRRPESDIQFKLTLGSWQTVEVGPNGQDTQNRGLRRFYYSDTLWLKPANFKDGSLANKPKRSTASKRIKSYLVKSYNEGQSIKVWIWAPSDTTKKHPVLYMHDGLNLFDDSTAFASEWQVDETLERLENRARERVPLLLHQKKRQLPIVVGIDNSNARMAMLSPFKNKKYGGGEGDQYVRWIINTLKPFVDSVYAGQVDKDDVFIGGSSLGGLISAYAMIKYPEVFNSGFCFSPALWFNPEVLNLPLAKSFFSELYSSNPYARFYAYGGAKEGSQVDFYTKALADKFTEANYKVRSKIEPEGTHQEIWWRNEFEEALETMVYHERERRCCKCPKPRPQPRPSIVSHRLKFRSSRK